MVMVLALVEVVRDYVDDMNDHIDDVVMIMMMVLVLMLVEVVRGNIGAVRANNSRMHPPLPTCPEFLAAVLIMVMMILDDHES